MRVLQRREWMTIGQVVWQSTLHAIMIAVMFRIVLIFPLEYAKIVQNMPRQYILGTHALLVSLIVPVAIFVGRRVSFRIGLLYALLLTLLVVMFDVVTESIYLGFSDYTAAVPLKLIASGEAVVTFLTASLIVTIIRVSKGPVILQDGNRCFRCGYDLTGTISHYCPECGGQCKFPLPESMLREKDQASQ
jgi:hypothetical protein